MSLGLADTERDHRERRIIEDARKAPIVSARRVVQHHIATLRARGLIAASPTTPGLIMALEQLTHDVASAVLDARLTPRKETL